MKTASAARVQKEFGSFLEECKTGPIVVTNGGKAVAVLVSLNGEVDLKEFSESQRPHLSDVLQAARQRVRQQGAIPHDEFWRQMRGKEKRQKKTAKNG